MGPDMKSVIEVKRYMLNNAADYIERSINSYTEEDYKVAILFLWSGLQLFMKLRLFEINPVLIYENNIYVYNKETRKPDFVEFDITGNRKTLTFQGILNRFKSIELDSSLFEFREELESIQRIRNRVEHYVDDINELEYSAVIERVLPFMTSFIEEELGEPLNRLLPSWDRLLEIKSFYDDRVERMKSMVSAVEYHTVKDGGEFSSAKCPNCTDGIMILGCGNLYCSVCGYESDYKTCSRCGETFLVDDWGYFNEDTGVCNFCFENDLEE